MPETELGRSRRRSFVMQKNTPALSSWLQQALDGSASWANQTP
jgi:hypothetical protein